MVKRTTALLLAVFIFGLALSLATPALAAPALQATPQAPYANWGGNFTIAQSVPFVWIRNAPSSAAGVLTSLQPGTSVAAASPRNQLGQVWDGVQWWGYITARGVAGWVEIKSLVATSVPPTVVGPTVAPDQPAPWQLASTVRVRLGIQFVWIRSVPASDAPIVTTVFPGNLFSLIGGPTSDNRQWWWQVRDQRTSREGWVEQNSLELVQGVPATVTVVPTVAPGQWQIGDVLQIRTGIPFAWLRTNPSSVGGVVFTARPGQQVRVLSGPVSDGTQNWWVVQGANSPAAGWVEEQSLVFMRRP